MGEYTDELLNIIDLGLRMPTKGCLEEMDLLAGKIFLLFISQFFPE